MTRLQLKEAVTWEGRLTGDDVAIAELNEIISDAIVFIGQSHPELLLVESTTHDISTANPTPYVQALAVDRVELQGVAGLTESATIPEEGKVVGPAPLPGWPKCYNVEGNAANSSVDAKGLRVRLSGGGSLDVGVDTFTVWWKKIPTLTNDTHIVPDAWVPYLKKEILARLALFKAKGDLEVAKGYTLGAGQALQAHTQDAAQSTASSN